MDVEARPRLESVLSVLEHESAALADLREAARRGARVAKGVHDGFERDASQRPTAKRNVESFAREIERFGVMNGEADLASLLVCQCGARP